MISRLVKGECDGIFFQDKNELDPCGNTPLILAVKLGNIDAIKILCDLTCCPKIKSLSNCKIKLNHYLNIYSTLCVGCCKLD